MGLDKRTWLCNCHTVMKEHGPGNFTCRYGQKKKKKEREREREREKEQFWSSLVVQQVKELVLSLLWFRSLLWWGFDP